jgi:hypothetical protein
VQPNISQVIIILQKINIDLHDPLEHLRDIPRVKRIMAFIRSRQQLPANHIENIDGLIHNRIRIFVDIAIGLATQEAFQNAIVDMRHGYFVQIGHPHPVEIPQQTRSHKISPPSRRSTGTQVHTPFQFHENQFFDVIEASLSQNLS